MAGRNASDTLKVRTLGVAKALNLESGGQLLVAKALGSDKDAAMNAIDGKSVGSEGPPRQVVGTPIDTNATDRELRQAFDRFWLARALTGPYDKKEWAQLRSEFLARGMALPTYPNAGPAPVLCALYSAREGKPVGWDKKKLVEVAHRVVSGHPRLLRIFRQAMAHYGRCDQLRAEDRTGKWERAVEDFARHIDNELRFKHNPAFDDIIAFLFPELKRQEGTEE